VTDALPDEARHNDSLLYHIDLAPTLCELLGIPAPTGWQGASFADAIKGDDIGSREYLVLGQGAHTYQRAVRTRDHMYIRTYHPGCMKVDWEQLYDVTADPHLTVNLIDREPELAARMRSHLAEWLHTYAGRPGALPDPMQTTLQVGPTYYNDPVAYAQHLRETGRAHLADDLELQLATATGATPISWHSPDVPWTPEKRAMVARMFGDTTEELD